MYDKSEILFRESKRKGNVRKEKERNEDRRQETEGVEDK
jgi:hypothetical protein